MDSNNKRIAKNTGLLYLRQLLTLALSLYTARLTLQVLGETDYGVYATVAGFTALLSTFTSSFSSGTQRFITIELGKGDYNSLNRIYCTSTNLHVLLSAILLVVGEVIGVWFIYNKMTIPPERIVVAFWVYQFTLLNSALVLINVPNQAEIIAHEDMGVWAFVSVVEALLRFLSVILLFVITWDKLFMYAFFLFVIQFMNRTFCMAWSKKKYCETRYHFEWNKELIKSMLSVTGWIGLINLCVTGFVQGVNILLNVFFGPVMNAAYAIAMQAYSGIRQFCSSFQLASNPQIVKLYASDDLEKMHNLLITVCKISFYLIFALSMPFLMNAHYVLELWLKDVPPHTELFFVLLLIYAFVDVLAYPLDIAAQATGKLRHYSICVSIAILLILVISYIILSMGAMAESIYVVAIIMSFVCLMIRLSYLKSLIGMSMRRFLKDVVLRIIVVAFMSFAVCFVVKSFLACYPFGTIFVFFPSFVITLLVIYFLGMTYGEKMFVKKVFIKIVAKLSIL